jgi:hypothetical protein
MKNSAFATTLLLAATCPLLAENNDVGKKVLISAERQASIFHEGNSPMRLEVNFTAQQSVPVEGHLTFVWAARDRWRREVKLSDFQQIEIRNGDKLFTSRNLPFTPFRIGELVSLLQFSQSPDSFGRKETEAK